MDRINRILEHPIFKECVKLNEMAEAQRCFCHHDIEHLCAVARIAMLLNVEEGLGISKDVVYGAALLHDSGRYKQYANGTPHEEAGAEFARLILPECGYKEEEVSCMISAITSHRGSTEKTREGALAELLYRADKMSRNCQFCKVYEECNWSKEKKDRMFIW
jgi:HD superfamily phosphodiesterase